jgi:serine/threonine protein kinase
MTITRFCERCERVTQDGHLWCPDKDCPAEEGYPVFVYGDYLGDLKVTKLIAVWRTAALYEAQRDAQAVWLKVAHASPECEDRLRREAVFLKSIHAVARKPSFFGSLRPGPRSIQPLLQPPYTGAKRPYGEISFRGEARVYSVFQPGSGSLLSDLLLENPQVWHYEAAWVIATLASALRPLASRNLAHLSLTPNTILVQVDAKGHWRPALLDFGWMWDGKAGAAAVAEVVARSEPAYTAPELLTGKAAPSPAADVYSLGLILYEMLAGRPGYEPKLRRDEQVRRAVTQNREPLPVDRPELEGAGVVKIVEKAIAPSNRYTSVQELAKAISAAGYGAPPPEERPIPPRTYVIVGLLATLLLVVALAAGYVLWQVWMTGGA